MLKNKFILKRHWLVALAFIYIKECLDIIDLYDMYNITKLFFPPKCSCSISHKHFVHPFYYPFYNSPIYLEYIFFSPFDKTQKKIWWENCLRKLLAQINDDATCSVVVPESEAKIVCTCKSQNRKKKLHLLQDFFEIIFCFN